MDENNQALLAFLLFFFFAAPICQLVGSIADKILRRFKR